jgi:hypothetical protein
VKLAGAGAIPGNVVVSSSGPGTGVRRLGGRIPESLAASRSERWNSVAL